MPKAKYKKRADGRYLVQLQIGYKEDGRPKYKNIYGYSIAELENKLSEFKVMQNRGIVIEETKLTFGEWANVWLKTYKSDVSPGTYKMYQYVISKHFKDIDNINLKKISPSHVQNVINELNDFPRAQQKTLLTIKQILNQAVANEYIYKNAATGIKIKAPIKPKKRALSNKEINEIFTLNIDDTARAFIGIMLYCGLRRGEAWALTKNDINLKNKTIDINKAVFLDGGIKIGPPKSKASIRTVPIPETLYSILKNYLNKQQSLYLFNNDGEIISEHFLRKMWNDFLSKYNTSKGGTDKICVIPSDITPHIFRHTYATTLYYAGVDIKTAQYLLGHSTISMTMDIYTHLDKEKKSESLEKLNSYLNLSQSIISQ